MEAVDSGEHLFTVKWVAPDTSSSREEITPKAAPRLLVRPKPRLPRLSKPAKRHLSTLVTKLARLDLSVGRHSEPPKALPEPRHAMPQTSNNFLARSRPEVIQKVEAPRPSPVPYTEQVPLPDGYLVHCTPACSLLLNSVLSEGKVRHVIRDLYRDSDHSSPAGSSRRPFEYVFSLTNRLPLRSVNDLPKEAHTVIISPRVVPLFSSSQVEFDAAASTLVNLRTRTTEPVVQETDTSFVPEHIVNALSSQPFVDQHWLKQQLAGNLPILASQVVHRAQHTKDLRGNWVRKLRLEQHYQELSPLNKGFLTRTSWLVPMQRSPDVHLSGYPPLEQQPKRKGTRSLNTTQTLPESPTRQTPVWKSMTDVQKAMMRLTEEIMSELELPQFCVRYSLSQTDLLALLEEFTVHALSSNTRKYAQARGISAEYLAAHYDVSIYALRAVNPALFDTPTSDERDIYGLISACGEVRWTDFVLFHCLALTQTCGSEDLVRFLLQVCE